MRRRVGALVLCAGLLPPASRAQDGPDVPDPKPAWDVAASMMLYWLPDDDQITAPTLVADRGKLHLEARYNYENLNTVSAWMGYNAHYGDRVSVDFTPMLGVVFGDTDGIAAGYHLTVAWRAFDFYIESEYVFDRDARADSYFYSWSELAWSPFDWLRAGLAAQRTRVYEAERDIQRGVFAGVSLNGVSVSAYVFNPDQDDATYVASLEVEF